MKTVLITGASRGIGKETALLFASQGYETILTCRQSMDALAEVQREIETTYHTPCRIALCDAVNFQEVQELFAGISRLDVLVNNAGIAHFDLLQDMTVADWHHVIDTNLSSVFYTCKLSIPLMLAAGKGRIINVSSIWGNTGASMETAYSASKGGVNALTRALAKELAPSGIPVNAVALGVIDTDMNRCLSSEDIKTLQNDIPACRLGTPREAAQLILQISEMPTYLTGQIITMSGGYE
ncbi:MAG: SDR family NAD(P)-dependent oxidoreductase [Lachnospiraceae bacterium]|nr:SDR family NAD(P)-dependent oxidoreductase [Lachnospiraceae bacterium]